MKSAFLALVLVIAAAMNGCQSTNKANSSGAKDITATANKIRISSPQFVGAELSKKVLAASGRYLCFGLAISTPHFVIWSEKTQEDCYNAGGRYVNGAAFDQFKQTEPSEAANVILTRYMIGKLQIGDGELDTSLIGGYTLTNLCDGHTANICDLVIDEDKTKIEMKN